jgi:hypothetical protein
VLQFGCGLPLSTDQKYNRPKAGVPWQHGIVAQRTGLFWR